MVTRLQCQAFVEGSQIEDFEARRCHGEDELGEGRSKIQAICGETSCHLGNGFSTAKVVKPRIPPFEMIISRIWRHRTQQTCCMSTTKKIQAKCESLNLLLHSVGRKGTENTAPPREAARSCENTAPPREAARSCEIRERGAPARSCEFLRDPCETPCETTPCVATP